VTGREAALWAASAYLEADIKTNVYIDGFNFYYGALRKTPYRWVNVRKLCELLLPRNAIADIKYFTALVSARPNDPDQAIRQQLYLRALRTLPGISVHLGHFLSHEVMMPLAARRSAGSAAAICPGHQDGREGIGRESGHASPARRPYGAV
jgi:hypothetical protein